jgi:hypothetical protein
LINGSSPELTRVACAANSPVNLDRIVHFVPTSVADFTGRRPASECKNPLSAAGVNKQV